MFIPKVVEKAKSYYTSYLLPEDVLTESIKTLAGEVGEKFSFDYTRERFADTSMSAVSGFGTYDDWQEGTSKPYKYDARKEFIENGNCQFYDDRLDAVYVKRSCYELVGTELNVSSYSTGFKFLLVHNDIVEGNVKLIASYNDEDEKAANRVLRKLRGLEYDRTT
jgi:hypothetical protein